MTITLDDLITPLTEEQVLASFLSILDTLGMPTRLWRKGGARRTILRAVAATYAGYTQLQSDFVRGSFLDYSTGPWLTLLARYVYGVERTPATFATGLLTFTNTGGGLYTFGPGEVRARNPVSRKVYTNSVPFTVNPGATLAGVAFIASEAGASSSAAPGTIVELETTLLGVEVTNPASFAATDEELDPDLRTKCRNKLAALSPRGPRGAYAYAVQTATRLDGAPVDINRFARSLDENTGTITIWCASPSGAPLAGDLDRVAVRVEEVARPDTVKVIIAAATEVALTATITVWSQRQEGVSSDDVKALVEAALIEAVKSYPIGGIAKPPTNLQGYLYGDWIAGVAKSAHASIYDVDGSDVDLELDPGEVATLATTVTVRIVEPS